jgi:hypothetical protein
MTLKKSQKRMKEIGRGERNNARDRLWFQLVSGMASDLHKQRSWSGCRALPSEIGMSITGLPAGL